MAEEKKMMGHGKVFTVLGILAVVYGIVNYLSAVLSWPPYGAWITGGIILILVGWAKKSMG